MLPTIFLQTVDSGYPQMVQFRPNMKKLPTLFVFVLLMTAAVTPSAMAQFSVDWGVSDDTGNSGFADLNTWFASNGYGGVDAQTGYIGYGAADSDPFFFNAGSTTFEVVQTIAGNTNLTSFGFYTGTGLGKSLTEVIGDGATGPENANPGSSWGVYINTPKWWQGNQYVNWFVDRAENDPNQTKGSDVNAGGDPQGLVYRLKDNEYLIAWEDLDYTNLIAGQSTDRDFNDAYLKVTVTPEPASMALFGLGAGALGLTRLRRKKKSL